MLTYIFVTILVDGNMDCAKRASTDLLLDHVLVDPMFSNTVILARDVFRMCI